MLTGQQFGVQSWIFGHGRGWMGSFQFQLEQAPSVSRQTPSIRAKAIRRIFVFLP